VFHQSFLLLDLALPIPKKEEQFSRCTFDQQIFYLGPEAKYGHQ